ncbi:MAG: hypothetical protein M1825_001027 [Sarcosagium campestre]|nr:MAG: hypothetical protein M1825_001027 [Sarcosagium campestre]
MRFHIILGFVGLALASALARPETATEDALLKRSADVNALEHSATTQPAETAFKGLKRRGFTAYQAAQLALRARKGDLENQLNAINQSRAQLANQANALRSQPSTPAIQSQLAAIQSQDQSLAAQASSVQSQLDAVNLQLAF